MNFNYLRPLTLFCLMLLSSSLLAQNRTLNDVMSIKLKSMGPIYNDSEVNGYYLFYETSEPKKGEKYYMLNILDQNLNEVVKKKLTEAHRTDLVNGVYNGKILMLEFRDHKNLYCRQYDNKGDLVSTKTIKRNAIFLGDAQGLSPVPGMGFVHYQSEIQRNSRHLYSIEYIPNAGTEGKEWTVTSPKDSKLEHFATHLAANDKVILTLVTKGIYNRPNQNKEYLIMAIGVEDGNILFEKNIEDSTYTVEVISGSFDDEKIHIFGTYYDEKAKASKSQSIGIFCFTIDLKGNVTNRQYISWANDFSQFYSLGKRGKNTDIGHLFLHDFVKIDNGKFYGIAESYQVSPRMGISSAQMGGSSARFKFDINDFYVLEFSPDFNLIDVKCIEKTKMEIFILSQNSFSSAKKIATLANEAGNFNYAFTTQSKDRSLFSIGYLNDVDPKRKKEKWVFGSINYADGEITHDVIKFDSEATRLGTLPGKPGYVLIYEYFGPKKKMDIRLEKLNF